MTLQEALTFAAQQEPTLRAARARIEVARRGVAAARAEWLPQLGATAQLFVGTMNNTTAMFLGTRAVDLPRIGASRSDPQAGWSSIYPSTLVALGLRQNVYDFGRIAAQTAIATEDTQLAAQGAALESLAVAFQVESGYFAVLAAHAIERTAEDAYARARARADLVRAGTTRGLRAPIDLTRAEADLTRFDVGRTRAHGGVEAAQAAFATVVGVPEPLLDAAPMTEPAAPLPALGDALQDAFARHPALRAALARLVRQQALTRATTLSLAPALQLTGTVSGRAGGAPLTAGPSGLSGFAPSVPNWDVGVVLSAPVFDGITLARRAQSRAAEEAYAREVDAVRRQLLGEIQRAFSAFHVAAATEPALRATADAARRNYEQATTRFQVGLATSVELADAEALRTDAEMAMAIGRFDTARARAAFNRAIAHGL